MPIRRAFSLRYGSFHSTMAITFLILVTKNCNSPASYSGTYSHILFSMYILLHRKYYSETISEVRSLQLLHLIHSWSTFRASQMDWSRAILSSPFIGWYTDGREIRWLKGPNASIFAVDYKVVEILGTFVRLVRENLKSSGIHALCQY